MENKYEQSIINLRKEFHKTRLAENISVNPTDLYNVIYPEGLMPVPDQPQRAKNDTTPIHIVNESKYNIALDHLVFYLHSPVPYDRSQKEHWDFAFRKALDEFFK